MYSNKIQHPANFRFAERLARGELAFGKERVELKLQGFQDSIFRVELSSRRWPARQSQAELTLPEQVPARGRRLATQQQRPTLTIDARAGLTLSDASGAALLQGKPGRSFGVCGSSWLLNLVPDAAHRFYGLGGKWGPFEKSGLKTRCWNSDVWADFDPAPIRAGSIDPSYTNLPYLIVQRGQSYLGILVDNPQAVFFSTQASFSITGKDAAEDSALARDNLFLGADAGRPILYFIVGPSLAELTCKLQRLVGTTPRPPLWALGHHQSRWGYASFAHLDELARKFADHAIPNDGLWLDIDYMDRFKVFSFDKRAFERPKQQLAAIEQRRQKVVPILDPGVKRAPGYDVYEQGLKHGHFCQNPEGDPYVGFVWPGQSHFPDFSRADTRDWWAACVAKFARLGIAGAWIDMNDPSTGAARPDDMLFDRGRQSHSSFHNQYALGMARATSDGFLKARPNQRPFVLSRSAFISMSRVSAVWTGDNVSNEAHLRGCIPTSLNLALSGIPFNGPDVPGFGGDADDDLMRRWYKAGFLFPFFRNHSCTGTRRQEPWAFSTQTLRVVRQFIRLRYKLLPYLYGLFIEQERSGAAILRPMAYDFPNEPRLAALDDQFMLGPALLHAPCLSRAEPERSVVLPKGWWFDLSTGQWLRGGRRIIVRDQLRSTPLFVRNGSAIPMQLGTRKSNAKQLGEIELHVFLKHGSAKRAAVRFDYEFDDGQSFAYRNGAVTRVGLELQRRGKVVHVDVNQRATGHEPLSMRLVCYAGEEAAVVSLAHEPRRLALRAHRWDMLGHLLETRRSVRCSL